MKRPARGARFTQFMLLGVAFITIPIAALHAKDNESRVRQGFALNPVPLNLNGKNPALVGLGSYIVNSGGCNDCHTNPA